MKLIQQLERKLSWRGSRNPRNPHHQPTTPGLAEAKQRKENSKKRQQQLLTTAKNAAAVRVSDTEFSPYISFGTGLKTVPLNDNHPTSSSYEVVAIRTRAPFQSVNPGVQLYSRPHHAHQPQHHPRSPSPRREGPRPESGSADGGSGDSHLQQDVEHIYDQIDCHLNQHRRSSSLSPTSATPHQIKADHWSPSSEGKPAVYFAGAQSPTPSSGSNESSSVGPITCASSRRRRNRIKTNPWFAGSPWATKGVQDKENQQENIYESIENLLNNRRKQQQKLNQSPPPINQNYYNPPFAQRPEQTNYSNHRHFNPGTYLKRPARPTTLAIQQQQQQQQQRKHLIETYPTSPYLFSNQQNHISLEGSPSDDLHLFTSPSIEFLNQSQQLCRQISSYFDQTSKLSPPPSPPRDSRLPSLDRKVEHLQRSSTDSMETIDLSPANLNHSTMSEWSLAFEDNDDDNDHHNDHQSDSVSTSLAPPPPPSLTITKSPSPPSRNKRKLQSPTNLNSRPESLYSNPRSTRQSAKVDRLKCQLKDVVHAAIQQAKKKKV